MIQPLSKPAVGFPVPCSDGRPGRSAFDPDAGIVLLRAQDVIGESAIRVHAIDLRGRLVIETAPVIAAVKANLRAAVICKDQPVTVRRIDPEIMMIAVRRREVGESLSAIQAAHELDVEDIKDIVIGRIDIYPVEIPCPLLDIIVGIQLCPRVALVRADI